MSPPILERAGDLLGNYDVIFADVWGVMHDGRRAHAAAGDALARFRERGGAVVLVSNVPRAADAVAAILDAKGVRRDAWDAIVASGDLVRGYVAARGFARLHHIGPARDLDLFATITAARVGLAEAEALVVTGLNDDRRETAEDYRPRLGEALGRRLPLVCANPDLVVDIGGELLPCAGAVAAVYEGMGGTVYWAGKPHAPAYETAVAAAQRLRAGPIDPARILAIGDALHTDIAGAAAFGLDALFIAHGVHRDDLMPHGTLDADRLATLFRDSGMPAIGAMTALRW